MTPALAIFFGAMLLFGHVSDDFERAQIARLSQTLAQDYPGKQVGVGFECRSLAAAMEGARAVDADANGADEQQAPKQIELIRSGRCIYFTPSLSVTVTEVARMGETNLIEVWVVEDAGKPMFILRKRSPSL